MADQIEDVEELEHGEKYKFAGGDAPRDTFRVNRDPDSGAFLRFEFDDGWTDDSSEKLVQLKIDEYEIVPVEGDEEAA